VHTLLPPDAEHVASLCVFADVADVLTQNNTSLHDARDYDAIGVAARTGNMVAVETILQRNVAALQRAAQRRDEWRATVARAETVIQSRVRRNADNYYGAATSCDDDAFREAFMPW
jgi:hypothetical protein